MKKVLVLGAGRTATALIEYLLAKSAENDWVITVADFNLETASQKVNNHPRGKAIQFNIYNDDQRRSEIEKADVVISFLLPSMHILSAKECIHSNTNLITASYVSMDMADLNEEAKAKGLIFLNEMGLDPGIDHMDAVNMINRVRSIGGKPYAFKSYCGGLVSPEHDDNPWGYKFSWSPMSVVLAGQGNAKYVEEGRMKIVPYNRLFLNTETIEVPGLGEYEAYPNRDSLTYTEHYGIEEIRTFYRGTLRKPGFCAAWNSLVKLGLTDNNYRIRSSNEMSYREWIGSYLPSLNGNVESSLIQFLDINSDHEILERIKYLGLLSDKKIKIENGTPAEILLSLLEEKWRLNEHDHDMVIMQSEVEFEVQKQKHKLVSTMKYIGKEKTHTAMTYTAGLPAAIGARLILQNKIKERGVIIPVHRDIYEPALKELEEYGIKFDEKEILLG